MCSVLVVEYNIYCCWIRCNTRLFIYMNVAMSVLAGNSRLRTLLWMRLVVEKDRSAGTLLANVENTLLAMAASGSPVLSYEIHVSLGRKRVS
jgi:hypothetical protein